MGEAVVGRASQLSFCYQPCFFSFLLIGFDPKAHLNKHPAEHQAPP